MGIVWGVTGMVACAMPRSRTIVERRDPEALAGRLVRVGGQLDGVLLMLREGRTSRDIIVQLRAARAGLEQVIFALAAEELRLDLRPDLSDERRAGLEKILDLVTRF